MLWEQGDIDEKGWGDPGLKIGDGQHTTMHLFVI